MRHGLIIVVLLSMTLVAFGSAQAQEAPSVQVTANAPGWITVAWEHSGNGADHYQVQRQQPAYTWIYVTNVGSYTDTGLQANTTYAYRVCAVDGAGNATCSPWISARTLPTPAGTSGTVAPIITGHDDAPDGITISWTSSESYGSYNVRWAEKGQAESQTEVGTSGTSGSYSVGGLQPNHIYVFRVQGCHRTLYGSSCGYWSATLQVTTPVPLPPPPTAPVFAVSSPDAYTIVLSWSVSPDQKITRTLIERDRKAFSDTPAAVIKFADGRIRPNTEYEYRVCLFNKVGRACSPRVTAIGKPIPPTALADVTISKGRIPSGPVKGGVARVATSLKPVVLGSWRNTAIPGQFITVEREDLIIQRPSGRVTAERLGPAWIEINRIKTKDDPTAVIVDPTSDNPNPLNKPGNSYRLCAVVPALGAAGKICSASTTLP